MANKSILFLIISLGLIAAIKFIAIKPQSSHFMAFWGSEDLGVHCRICPYECFMPEGFIGKCNFRMNSSGRLKIIPSSGRLSPSIEKLKG